MQGRAIWCLFAAAVAITACGDDDGGDDAPGDPDAGVVGPKDYPSMDVPASTTPEAGIRREVFRVPGFTAPANPDSGEATPAALNATQVVRYRVDVDPPAPARAILLGYPGFLGGAGSFEMLARHVVRRSAAAGEPVEVWAIDRRANLLEDTSALDTAEAAGDPEIANGYYNGRDTIDGAPFAGHPLPQDVSYMSEWGLETHVEDLRAVIELVPEDQRAARIVLMGHSLGASFAEVYAAWRFDDGVRGAEQLAGLVLIDGILGDTPLTEDEYLDGVSGGFLAITGLTDLRGGDPVYFELPVFGVAVLPSVEILSMRTLLDPDAVIEDEVRDNSLRIQLTLGANAVPAMTNEAALGFGFDSGSNSIVITAVSCGVPTGGPVEEYDNALAGATLVRPTDPDATYTWDNATATTDGEFTPIENLAFSFVHGRTNFAEWYFPRRIPLDIAAVAGAAVPEDGYQAQQGLRAFDGALIDVPILAIPTELVEPGDYDALSARVQSTVTVLAVPAFTHVDPTTAADRDDNPIPGGILQFAYDAVGDGDVTIPVQE